MFPVKIRADLHINHDNRKLVLAASETEKPEHLALRLAAFILFWDEELTNAPSSKHPALFGQPFRPDLLGTDITGSVSIWVECGNTSTHKILKVLRRWRQARVIVLKETPTQAQGFRELLQSDVPGSERVEVYSWAAGGFPKWIRCLSEKTDIVGEAGGKTLNLVVNEKVYLADLVKC